MQRARRDGKCSSKGVIRVCLLTVRVQCDAVKPPCGPCKSQRLKCIYINEALSDSMERSVTAKTQEESGQSRLVAATAGSDHSGLRSPKAASTANLDECSPSFPQSNAVTDNVIEAEDTNMPDVGKACFYALWSSTSTDRAVKSKSGNTTSLEHVRYQPRTLLL